MKKHKQYIYYDLKGPYTVKYFISESRGQCQIDGCENEAHWLIYIDDNTPVEFCFEHGEDL